jgi:hypothetical protein
MRNYHVLSGLLLAVFWVAFLVPVTGFSEEAPSAEKRALAKAQSLLKLLNTQKVAAETELASVKLQLEEQALKLSKLDESFKAQTAALTLSKANLAAATTSSAGFAKALETSQKRLAHSAEQLAQLTARQRETERTLQETAAHRAQVANDLEANIVQLKDSERKNLALYQANQALLDEFSNEGTFKKFFRSEPLTGVRQVQIENLRQDYANQLADQLRDANRAEAGNP